MRRVEERFTDVGNARRLVAAHGDDVRYVPQWNAWLVWDGARWLRDDRGEIVERAKQVAAGLWQDALGERDPAGRKEAVRWAQMSEGARGIRAMIELARTHPGVPVVPDELDADPWLFNVANGTIDLRRGVVRPHDRCDLLTKLADVDYDASAQAPLWQQFLEEVLPDAEVRSFVQRAVGYSLTGSTREQVLFFAYGTGANGKNTLFDTLLATIGDYGRQADPEILLARDNVHPTGVADLQGARLVVTSEIDDGRRLAEATVKRLTGDKTIKARFMRGDFFEFTASHKLFLHANHRPSVRGTDHAIWRRMRLIPFTVTIPDDRKDKTLPDRLLEERQGVLAWAVDGCLAWQRDGLHEPEAVLTATAAYRAESDVVGAFIAEECLVAEVAMASAADLYQAYDRWCEATGERSMNQRRFGQALTERGFERAKYGAANRWHWHGIGLLTNPSDPSDPSSGINPHTRAHVGGTESKGRMGSLGSSEPSEQRLPYRDGGE